MAKDHYQILGLANTASDDDIKKAYRKLALQYHPDRNPGKEDWANEKFKEINEAYGVLGDPTKRRQYDQFGTTGNVGDIFSSPYTRTTFEDLMKDFNQRDFGLDFLDGVFGGSLKNRGFSFRVYGAGSGTQQVNRDEIFGRAQRSTPAVTYQISISKEQATKGLEKDLVRNRKKLRVKIPAGVKDGTNIRLRNARKITDKKAGDIIVQVRVN